MEFKRKIYDKMLKWKKEYAPHYALFIKGARRVGKSTLALKLGKEEYKSYIEIRFDRAPDEIKNLFVNSLEDLDILFNQLQIFYKTRLYPNESLIILDEIQLFPKARQALKTLLEDKRYDYIETGSLASITKKSKEILIPSEEYQIEVQPMDFEEFMWACGDEITTDIIKEHYNKLLPFGQINKDIMKRFREYLLVGGMPQAVVEYVNSKDFGKVDFIKQNILNLYENDIEFQNEENPTYIKNILMHIPSELSKHDKHFVVSHIKGARKREYKEPIKWLNEANIVNIAESVSDPSVAFNLSTMDNSFKCYMADTGLLISLAYKNKDYLENELYKSILFDKLHINEGMIIENAVCQALKANGHNLYYYKKIDKDTKKTIMEVDFLIRQNNKVCPVEVKSSNNYQLSSLLKFKTMFNSQIKTLYVLHEGDLKREDNIIYLPYYMAFCL